MSGRQRTVQVYVDVDATGGPTIMGTLHAQSAGREEVFSFEYAPEWLRNEAAFAFDLRQRDCASGAQSKTKWHSRLESRGEFHLRPTHGLGELIFVRRARLKPCLRALPGQPDQQGDFISLEVPPAAGT
jgi:hypothetical protein